MNCKCLLLISGITAVFLPAPAAQEQTNEVSPRATQVLRDACRYLAEAPSLSLTAEVWREHVGDSGQKLQFTEEVKMEVKRPNRMHVDIASAHTHREFWYDGKTLTILDRNKNLFSTTAMPGTLDAALDKAHDQFGIDLPLIDLAVSDPYANATARVKTGRYFETASAMGYACHHLAFTQDNVDWQVWIEDGPQPLIRKFVITHKNEPGAPEFTALIRSWNFSERIAESDFVFEPPRGAEKVNLQPAVPQLSQASQANTAETAAALPTPKNK